MLSEFNNDRISRWLDERQISQSKYKSLSDSNTGILHDLICIPPGITTVSQRKSLYKSLFPNADVGRNSIDPTDYLPDLKIKEFFTLKPEDALSDLEMY
jgi:hypothetical protein